MVSGEQDDNQPHRNCSNACLHFLGGSPPLQFSLDHHPLQVVRLAKLVGVTVDVQLTWQLRLHHSEVGGLHTLHAAQT
ncbi:hypothetical protein E2C01_029381 [Portunus trituberculatus]|uniref:Uncharacterized protein n=1 Tax=Portunus trituberculatus TaxID=210409 RepID=A0A5B7EP37_PORTR|nr:hypothetical protein [Portunus trituberculatus]